MTGSGAPLLLPAPAIKLIMMRLMDAEQQEMKSQEDDHRHTAMTGIQRRVSASSKIISESSLDRCCKRFAIWYLAQGNLGRAPMMSQGIPQKFIWNLMLVTEIRTGVDAATTQSTDRYTITGGGRWESWPTGQEVNLYGCVIYLFIFFNILYLCTGLCQRHRKQSRQVLSPTS